jgi:hypothetical protein
LKKLAGNVIKIQIKQRWGEEEKEWGGDGGISKALLDLHFIPGIMLISTLLVHVLRQH